MRQPITIRNFLKRARPWLIGALAGIVLATGVGVMAQPGISPNFAWLRGAALGANPALVCQGLDTNVNCNIVTQGTGTLLLNGAAIPGLSGGAGVFTTLSVSGTSTLTGGLLSTVGTVPTLTATRKAPPLVIAHNITPTGNVGAGEDTVTSYTIPANTLNANGQSFTLNAIGFTAANANVKRWRVHWGAGATVVLDSTAFAMNNVAVRISCDVVRTGAAAQVVSCIGSQGGPITTGQAWNVGVGGGQTSVTGAEDLTLAQPITITAEATADNDQVIRSSNVIWYPQGQ